MRRPSLKSLSLLHVLRTSIALTALNPASRKEKFTAVSIPPVKQLRFYFGNISSMWRTYLQVFLIVLATHVSHAQNIQELTSDYFQSIRSGKYPSIPAQLSLSGNADAILLALQPYLYDTLHTVRSGAYEITYLTAQASSRTSIRTLGIDILARASRDQDPGNVGLALDYLTEFTEKDFALSAKDTIRNLVRTHNPYSAQAIKLAGFLQLTDLKKEITPYMQPGNPTSLRWAAIISLARMGEPEAVKDMMKRVTKLPVNDNVVYEVFPDLIYTRQREAITYLVEALKSDVKNCLPADAEREAPIVCGYRIMEQLAPVIKDYPLQLDESGDIKTNNYEDALRIVRQWFETNREYKILNDRY